MCRAASQLVAVVCATIWAWWVSGVLIIIASGVIMPVTWVEAHLAEPVFIADSPFYYGEGDFEIITTFGGVAMRNIVMRAPYTFTFCVALAQWVAGERGGLV